MINFTGLFRTFKIFLPVFMLLSAALISPARAGKLETGFAALAEFDFFKARKLFYQVNRKQPDPFASYGLSLIFSRTDNPFHNLDSAGKYIRLSYHTYQSDPAPFSSYGWIIDEKRILELATLIGRHKFEKVKQINTVAAYDHFLREFYLTPLSLRKTAIRLRDGLEYDRMVRINRSDSTAYFMLTYPQSPVRKDAFALKERQVYAEFTHSRRAESYEAFLAAHPNSSLANTAYENLYALHRQNNDVQGLARFVRLFPKAPQHLEAWKLLFSLSVKAYTYAELKKFLDVYPAFPLKNSILHELELNKLVLYPYKKDDYVGFIDPQGQLRIQPVYDAASEFREGLSLVAKGDSVFFINKENEDPFGQVYEEASVFSNGIAPVKQGQKWFFINRQGQTISGKYDEINELSDGVYVVKMGDRYGALDNFGQVLIEPRFSKLGDFRNGFAYFTEKGQYGFVSKEGNTIKTSLDWISDFDKDGLAVMRKDDKYGLVGSDGQVVLQAAYDLVMKTAGSIYILVANDLYGFFSAEGCYLTDVIYDYAREKPASYYSDGSLMRLLRKKRQALMNRNGNLVAGYGQFDETGFPAGGLMLVRKRNKYGYVDLKLDLSIPYKYTEADDFVNGAAIVALREKYFLIDLEGKELFSAPYEIERLSPDYYQLDDEGRTIVNKTGQPVLTGVSEVQKLKDGNLIITLSQGEIKLLSH